ncbi:hypothetical protein ACFWBB_05170 [Streptomyces sp. NPDC060000]|uniref:hypothetical protein n=1 Tax=Streptomyces sp. NPDC060000 TaxID=3347031 RepID=UPI00369B3FEF
MSDEQFDLVRSAVRVYKEIRPEIASAHPFWPLGLPTWEDAWIAHGLRGRRSTFLTVWRGGGGVESRTVFVPRLRGVPLVPEVLHTGPSGATAQWDAAEGTLTVRLPRPDTAVLLRLGVAH